MMIGKAAVYLLVQQQMAARQAGREPRHRLARSPIPGIPGHGQGPAAAIILQQALDIGIEHGMILDRATRTPGVAAGGGDFRDPFDRRAVEGPLAHHHLEAVVVGRVVGAGDHDAAVEGQRAYGEIEHGCGP